MALLLKTTIGLGLAALVTVAGLGAVLVRGKPEPVPAQCQAAAQTVQRLKALATGDMAGFQVAQTPRPLPPLNFISPEGKPISLQDFAGRVTLVNLWATWCVPCRTEMPGLDQLQATLGAANFEVLAINIDTRNLERPRQWLAENAITKLAYYADPKANMFQELRSVGKATGMPTTLLVDANGCELGILQGAADWSSADALKLVRAALQP